MIRKFSFATIIIGLIAANFAFAQNYQLLDEESRKDKEREEIIKRENKRRLEEEQRLLNEPISEEEIKNTPLVEVEPNNILPSDLTSVYSLVPYSVRREKWGLEIGVMYSDFHPSNYESKYLDPNLGSFDDLYGSAQTPLIELYLNYKRNFFLGGIGMEFGFGMYSNEAESNLMGDAKLDLKVIRAGVKYSADVLFPEPYIVPYGQVGVYTVLYDETQGNAKNGGTTGPAMYYSVGLMAQLNWMDKAAAVQSYSESGLENTFVFAELRQFMASSAENDPDFSTEMDIDFGISFEF